jgi:hypothetical protein
VRPAQKAQESFRPFARNNQLLNAMNTINATGQSVPGFWQKWWNALVKFFKRDGTCACASGKTSTPNVEQPKATATNAT